MIFPKCSTIAASFAIFFFLALSYAEKAPYSFVKEATAAPAAEYYDYIVAGGGAAGCALAATLSASAKVLLLERGGSPYENSNVTDLAGFGMSLADTSPTSAAQQFTSADGVFNHRARVLGGGSAINAGFHVRASHEYVRGAGWYPALVRESYEWVERKLVFRPRVVPWQAAVRGGLLEAGVRPDRGFTYEHLVGTKVGGTIVDENGYRHTAADLLEYADSAKTAVFLHATVDKILFNTSYEKRPKAYGVMFKDSSGTHHSAYLNNGPKNEIILSAGALGSPQLLMLSGLGPAEHLKSHGIAVIMEQPMVGRGMADNPRNTIVVPTLKPMAKSLGQVVGVTDIGCYILTFSGFFEQPSTQTIIAQEYARLANQTKNTRTETRLPEPSEFQVGHILEKVAGPFSSGHLELRSRDPNDNPKVTFNYFEDRRDLERCVKGMKIIKKVIESDPTTFLQYPFSSFQALIELNLAIPSNTRPRQAARRGPAVSLEQFCKETVMTVWHYHGGCQVDRVVDRDYKVIGVDALRVVDGSTFNYSPGTNPQATVMMLGRYMGHKLLQERSKL
ncbi:protein HOTHEAD-like [Andrographis paniculata]|uniref:protein HOTHEAD-like n=1 Tax=Andrographis paniculata TaxID=175694 RepID=UPI0021E88D8A|nr:protein HOTHEAD-like [Andrographis paniculata]